MDKYLPPYTVTDEMLELVSTIMENIGKLNGLTSLEKLPRLRRVNRIKSIHSSLAIEQNTLTIEQVTAVINGKKVLAPKNDIIAVENANLAYSKISQINPYDIKDLLNIHKDMMNGLVSQAGEIRSGQVGVYNAKGEVIHLAPPATFVLEHLQNLFGWLKESKTNMLIKSCVFHYEFEFIHPFRDGNGRMGRFWQTALLASWKPIFAWIPIESIIKDNQQQYYNAINQSTSQASSNPFILFMLGVIDKSIKDIISDSQNHVNHLTNQIKALLGVIQSYPLSATELMLKLKLKSRSGFRKNYLIPALNMGLISMTEPHNPTSKNQKYFKT